MRMEKQNSASQAYMKWAGYRESNRDSGRGEAFFLDIPPQKQTQDCAATVIWRPSLAAFF